MLIYYHHSFQESRSIIIIIKYIQSAQAIWFVFKLLLLCIDMYVFHFKAWLMMPRFWYSYRVESWIINVVRVPENIWFGSSHGVLMALLYVFCSCSWILILRSWFCRRESFHWQLDHRSRNIVSTSQSNTSCPPRRCHVLRKRWKLFGSRKGLLHKNRRLRRTHLHQ